MEEFRQQFLLDSLRKLKNLQNSLSDKEFLADLEKREVFRTLHTIKGTAETFNFASSSRLAHELETILANQHILGENFITLFTEGIGWLINSLEPENIDIPDQFVAKLSDIFPQNNQSSAPNDASFEIPKELLDNLSQTERKSFDSAVNSGKNLYCVEIGFDLVSFTDGYKNFREVLNGAGEVIAAFPNAKFNAADKIGFQILFASLVKQTQVEEIIQNHGAEITLTISPKTFTNDLSGILAKVGAYGEILAHRLDKTIEFEVFADEVKLSTEKLKIIFDILIHLARNAVDHAIEKTGKIEISVKADENGLHLVVDDNGSGIDLEKVKAKAIEKNLISADTILTEQATQLLIFQSEFSTASKLTEISGRGIGLDAVKDAVEKADGKITVESQSGKGTTFEIFLPEGF